MTTANGFPATLEQNYARYEYSLNGQRKAVTDANGNRAEMTFDGFDRQKRWIFPSNTPGYANQADYEEYGYDLIGNRLSLRKRDGVTIGYQYDALNRLTVKTVPASATGAPGYSVFSGYDVRGLQTYARFGSAAGAGITNAYDGFGRLTSSTTNMDGTARMFNSQYDAGSRRIVLSSPSNYYASYAYDALGRMSAYKEGATTVVQFNYDSAGRRSSLAFAGGTSTVGYGYDPVSRLSSLGRDLAAAAADQSVTFAHNPASQIVSRTMSNDAYASNTAYNVSRAYSVNGLNQYTAAGPASFTYDANGNLTSDGSTSFVYDAENRLVSASGAKNASLAYDPLGRLWQTSGGAAGTLRFIYDGDRLVEEYDGAGNRPRVYVHGSGADEPLVLYELTGGPVHRFYHSDHQGSIIALADDYGNALAINGYDSWGIPNAANYGRFGYTGQAWIAELGMYYYKARIYSPTLGRFMQTDPVGYKDQVNLYAYVGNDPVNHADPSGLARVCTGQTGSRIEACVGVDGNGNGDYRDNDLSRAQIQTFRSAYGGFISRHNGANLSQQGARILGTSNDATMLRVTTQFVGGAVPGAFRNTEVSINNNLSSDTAATTSWARYRGGPSEGTYYTAVNMGWNGHRTNPSELARTLLHEVDHHRDRGGMVTLNNAQHQRIDAWARDTLMRSGLGGMGCSPVGGYWGWFPDYPGC